ncbi:hypothetical protein H8K33_04655 [Undibacterium amnicola]|uniref:Tetratricopeptide repeat protein n=1 Tax=Undibacterium amnicola TaxID=1834038 RepID=A0ABR6XMR4_9BURK|nr:hypothetical protein [Undibacterium amnicola]MBC3830789.1 hypothetical protein [Undibacterium amnicola]
MKFNQSIQVIFFSLIITFATTTKILAVEKLKEQHYNNDEEKIKKGKQCISRYKEKVTAKVAEDWDSVIRLSKLASLECKNIFDDKFTSEIHQDLANAYYAQSKFKDALLVSNTCTAVYYANYGCHIEKSRALIALGKKVEAKESLRISKKIGELALDDAHRNLQKATSENDKELYTLTISNIKVHIQLIDVLSKVLAQ